MSWILKYFARNVREFTAPMSPPQNSVFPQDVLKCLYREKGGGEDKTKLCMLKIAQSKSESTEEPWAQVVELVLMNSNTSGAAFKYTDSLLCFSFLSVFILTSVYASLPNSPHLIKKTWWISLGLFLAAALISGITHPNTPISSVIPSSKQCSL